MLIKFLNIFDKFPISRERDALFVHNYILFINNEQAKRMNSYYNYLLLLNLFSLCQRMKAG